MICEACGGPIPEHEVGGKMVITRPHEIRSRGAGGKCEPRNQLRLCFGCHVYWDTAGPVKFICRFPHTRDQVLEIKPKLRRWYG
jgi:hypothetical protein